MKTKTYPVEEQVGNLLNVLKLHSGQFIRGKNVSGERKACSHLNPLMNDGGIQPSGPPLYGPRFFDTAAELEAGIASQVAKDPTLAGKYFAMPVEEWVFGSDLCGTDKTLAKVLAERPELSGAAPEKMENQPACWVLTLPPDEPIDVVLNRKGDGVSEDCFVTNAGDLTRHGFGQLHFERGECGVTVFADDRETFARIAAAI